MRSHYRPIFIVILLFAAAIVGAAQYPTPPTGTPPQTATPPPADNIKDAKDTKKKPEAKATPQPTGKADPNKPVTAESVAESVIIIYGGFGGRATLDQIRKTSIEHGRMSLVNAQGLTEQVNYQKWSIRGESLDKEKIRLDEEYPSIRYALIRSEDKTYGIFNEAIFTPRGDATKQFENRIFHGIEALLRYKESGSTVDLGGHDKIMGVDFYFVDLADKQGRKTRYYVSSKTYRVMMADYEEDGVKYRRKYYDYSYAQSTLVPFRTTLLANDKIVEETQVLTVTFGQKVDDDLFKSGT